MSDDRLGRRMIMTGNLDPRPPKLDVEDVVRTAVVNNVNGGISFEDTADQFFLSDSERKQFRDGIRAHFERRKMTADAAVEQSRRRAAEHEERQLLLARHHQELRDFEAEKREERERAAREAKRPWNKLRRDARP